MNSSNKTNKRSYSCFEERDCGFVNPLRHIKRWCRNIKHACQRIRYGYCDRDVWSIDWWFLSVVPNMLEDLKDTTHGYPSEPGDVSHALIGTGEPEEVDDEGKEKWREILSEMIFLFREANSDTCTRENLYEKEYQKAYKEFDKKYGLFGEKLLTQEDKAEKKRTGNTRMYTLWDVPEYKDIAERYHEERVKIDAYRDECKTKGLKLFDQWFWNLWD